MARRAKFSSGFYERVKALTPREQALAEEVPISDEIGLYTTASRRWAASASIAQSEDQLASHV